MPKTARLPNHLRPRREKVFGPGRGFALDRNAKTRIMVYARAWSAKHRQPGQHRGPLTRAFMEVLEALLWGFHNSRDGRCFPSYESIAEKAECGRQTVYEAIKALEFADVLTWVNRITRIRTQERDLFGQMATRWRIIRTSNAYVFRDPLPCHLPQGVHGDLSKSENHTGTLIQEVSLASTGLSASPSPLSPELDSVLVRLGRAMAERQEKENALSAA
jgi:hypothetical protein